VFVPVTPETTLAEVHDLERLKRQLRLLEEGRYDTRTIARPGSTSNVFERHPDMNLSERRLWQRALKTRSVMGDIRWAAMQAQWPTDAAYSAVLARLAGRRPQTCPSPFRNQP